MDAGIFRGACSSALSAAPQRNVFESQSSDAVRSRRIRRWFLLRAASPRILVVEALGESNARGQISGRLDEARRRRRRRGPDLQRRSFVSSEEVEHLRLQQFPLFASRGWKHGRTTFRDERWVSDRGDAKYQIRIRTGRPCEAIIHGGMDNGGIRWK